MTTSSSALVRWLPTLLGANLALAVVVLYEIGVLEGAEPDCECGQTREPAPPSPGPRAAASPASPGERPHPAHAAEREQLVEQVEKLETEAALLAEQNTAGELRYHDLSQAELEAMARNCDVRSDYPVRLEPQDLEDLALADDEREAYQRALERFAEQENELHRGLLRELAPANIDIDSLDSMQLRSQLVRMLGRGKKKDDVQLRRILAEERAGMRPAPDAEALAGSSVFARYTRARFSAGDRFAKLLEEELGPDRTRELRSVFGGWKGVRLREAGCPK